jgi:hypothetical protein
MRVHDSLPPEFEKARRTGLRRAYKQLAWWALAALIALGLLVARMVAALDAVGRPTGS